MTRALLTALLTLALVAGCASPSDEPGTDATPTGAPTTPTGATPGGAGAGGDDDGASGSGDDLGSDAARWYAFAFDREVDPKTGGSGKIKSFSYTNTQVEDGDETIVDVDVTVEGTSTKDIRTTKLDMGSGTFAQETVTTPLEVTQLRHVLTVVKDDTGERTAGDTSTVTVYVPTDELPEASTVFWYFAAMEWEGDEGTGTWEYFVSPAMQAEQANGSALYTPFTEGESDSWWGFEMMTATYGLSWFAPWVTGDQEFEEGSFSYGGYSQSVRRETISVGGYTFDGWAIEISGVSGEGSGGWMMKASADLPIPVAFRFGSSQEGGDSSVIAYELTDLELG